MRKEVFYKSTQKTDNLLQNLAPKYTHKLFDLR